MNFNLKTEIGDKKSDMSIILSLIKDTKEKSIMWYNVLDNLNLSKYVTFINIKKTNKKIRVDFIINKIIPSFNRIEFYMIYNNKENFLRKINGNMSNSLYKILNPNE
jgi:hypothetical protein